MNIILFLIIGLVARWDSLKDHSMFIEAAAAVSREHEDIYFVLVGRGIEWETPELAALIRTAGLQDRMILLGERDDIPSLTAAFDIACSSSITEGFPTTIGEAMACGVPCVVTDVGDAAAGGRAYTDARLYGRADAGYDAQGHGKPDAPYDRRRGAAGNTAHD